MWGIELPAFSEMIGRYLKKMIYSVYPSGPQKLPLVMPLVMCVISYGYYTYIVTQQFRRFKTHVINRVNSLRGSKSKSDESKLINGVVLRYKR